MLNGGKKTLLLSGVDIAAYLLMKSKLRIFLLGSTTDKLNSILRYHKQERWTSTIVGTYHGYIPHEKFSALSKKIALSHCQVVLIGMGFPKQELFIQYLKKSRYPCTAIGVGGSFDILSKSKRRAPILISKIGLEWLFRGVIEPKRMLKWYLLVEFVLKIMTNYLKKK